MMAITTEMIEAAYSHGKKVHHKQMDIKDAIKAVADEYHMNPASADFYIKSLRDMMRGQVFKKTINMEATEYYLKNIREDYGNDGLKKALTSIDLHINYYESRQPGKVKKQREIYQKYLGILHAIGPSRDRSIKRIVDTVFNTVSNSNGQQVLSTKKDKKVNMSKAELADFLPHLMNKQNNLCAHTDIEMVYDDPENDKQLWCSLDRIDSDGYYEKDNLQLVCRFVNMWKGASDDNEFNRLIHLVRSMPALK